MNDKIKIQAVDEDGVAKELIGHFSWKEVYQFIKIFEMKKKWKVVSIIVLSE